MLTNDIGTATREAQKGEIGSHDICISVEQDFKWSETLAPRDVQTSFYNR